MTTFALFQARRSDDPMAVHEQTCIQRGMGLSSEEFVVWNLVDSPPSAEFLDKADAYLIMSLMIIHGCTEPTSFAEITLFLVKSRSWDSASGINCWLQQQGPK